MIRLTGVFTVALLVALLAVPQLAQARTLLRSRSATAASVTKADVAKAAVATTQPGAPVALAPCKDRCIDYRSHRFLRCKFDPCTAKQIILQVNDPCCCCYVEVPVCVPCCCEGAPEVCARSGICGRHIVEYTWCCGYEVKVVFDKCGDVTVHTYGL
jgi:hypothetical protein